MYAYIRKITNLNKLTLFALGMVWIAIVALSIEVSMTFKTAFSDRADAEIVSTNTLPTLIKNVTPMTAENYQQRVDALNIPFGVFVKAEKDGISITAKNPIRLEAWLRVNQEVSLLGRGQEEWSFKKFCAGECVDAAFASVLVGTHRQFVVQ